MCSHPIISGLLSSPPPIDAARNLVFLLAVVTAVLLIMLIGISLLLARHSQRMQSSPSRPTSQRRDAWQEAGRRAEPDPPDEHDDPDEDAA